MWRFFAVIASTLVLMVAVASGRVQAQSMLQVVAEIKFCKTLTDDAQRLKCFDGLFAEKQQPPATWSIEESKSPIDDSPQVTGMLYADSSTDPSSLMSPTVLVLRCKEKKTEAYLGKPFTLFGANTVTVKVLVRINDDKSIETQWQPSSNGLGVFALAAVEFIRALPDNGKIFIRVTTFDGSTVDGAFTLGKVSEIRDKIAADCHWPRRRSDRTLKGTAQKFLTAHCWQGHAANNASKERDSSTLPSVRSDSETVSLMLSGNHC